MGGWWDLTAIVKPHAILFFTPSPNPSPPLLPPPSPSFSSSFTNKIISFPPDQLKKFVPYSFSPSFLFFSFLLLAIRLIFTPPFLSPLLPPSPTGNSEECVFFQILFSISFTSPLLPPLPLFPHILPNIGSLYSLFFLLALFFTPFLILLPSLLPPNQILSLSLPPRFFSHLDPPSLFFFFFSPPLHPPLCYFSFFGRNRSGDVE